MDDRLAIGELAARTGVATSALRFYEDEGLISSERTPGNQRRYQRSTMRRVSVIQAAQRVGVPLRDVAEALAALPAHRTPTTRDWQNMSRRWEKRLDRQIAGLEKLRDDLNGCIGCGCLSLKVCALFNPDDGASQLGAGPRYLLGNTPQDVV